MHWAITGQTAAEIIHARADAAKPNMGLTNWRGAKVRKEDVAIAKNYLNEPELAALNNLVEQYLVFAEGQAMRRIPMHMTDWITKLDAFLTLNDRDILTHAGRISHEMAQGTAEVEYDKYTKHSPPARRARWTTDFRAGGEAIAQAHAENPEERSHERSRNQSRAHRPRVEGGGLGRRRGQPHPARVSHHAGPHRGPRPARQAAHRRLRAGISQHASWPWSRPRRGMKR